MASSLAIRGIAQNDTPWAGAFEWVSAYAYLAWLAILAVTVIRHELGPSQTKGELGVPVPRCRSQHDRRQPMEDRCDRDDASQATSQEGS
jgi:hypothetical protein